MQRSEHEYVALKDQLKAAKDAKKKASADKLLKRITVILSICTGMKNLPYLRNRVSPRGSALVCSFPLGSFLYMTKPHVYCI